MMFIEVSMRLVKIPLLCLVVLLGLVGLGQAQALRDPMAPTLCASLIQSTHDYVSVVSFRGKPDTVVLMPVQLRIDDTDKFVEGFSFQINFDTTVLTPIKDTTDTTLIQFEIPAADTGGLRLKIQIVDNSVIPQTTPPTMKDTVVDLLTVNYYVDPDGVTHRNMLNCNFLPFGTTIGAIPHGTRTIFWIKFKSAPLAVAPQGKTATFTFYRADEVRTDNSTFPPTITQIGCKMPQESQRWMRTDVTPNRTEYLTIFPQYPVSSPPMTFTVDTGAVKPVIDSLKATAVSGGQSTLSWWATNADSVVITQGVTQTRIHSALGLSGFFTVTGITTTTTFTATGYSKGGTGSKTITVTVGGGGNGSAPVVVPTSSSGTVNEGQTISFSVTATDNDPVGGTITLSAPSLPTGASFPSQVGVASVTGTFNWTPNVGQKGTYQVTFQATDASGNIGSSTVSILVKALEYDRLFSSSAPPPAGRPVGGLRGTNEVFFPINLVSSKTVYGIQYDMAYPYRTIHIDSINPSGRIKDYAVYDNIGVTPGNIRVVTFGLNNEPVVTDTTTAVMWLVCTLDSSAVPWTSVPMRLSAGRESVDPNPNVASLPLVTDSGVIEIDNPGDVNIDHIIDVGDVVSIVSYVIGSYPLSRRQFATADVQRDDTVNVFDLVGDINLIYGVPITPSPAPPLQNAIIAMNYADISVGMSGQMSIRSELPTKVAGVQLEVSYDPNVVELGRPTVTSDYRNFVLQSRDNGNGKMVILLYHGKGALASPNDLIDGSADLVNVPVKAKSNVMAGNKSQLRLTKALMSTPTAGRVTVEGVSDPTVPYSFDLRQNYPNPFNPTTRIEFTISGSSDGSSLRDVSLEIFNVLGQKVKTLMNGKMPPGEHSIEWNATGETGQHVATGIYLYRLRVDKESQTRKMVFLK